jgi:hypothetical protein
VFAHSADPMDAEDWLCTMERELHTAQCDDSVGGLCPSKVLKNVI